MEIIGLTPDLRKKATRVVCDAFFDYPMLTYYFPDVTSRRRRLTWHMDKTLNAAMRYGEVYMTDDMSGVMFILPPERTRLSQGDFIRCGFLPVPLVMGFKNYKNSDECEKFVADTQERLTAGRPHYYLWGIVADPSAQRRGAGTALMKHLLSRTDAESLPVYLETHNKNNVGYYERFGFRLVHTDTIPGHGLEIWCMMREPGAGNT